MPSIKRYTSELTVEEFQSIIRETFVLFIEQRLNMLPIPSNDLITMKEVAALYKVSLVTIHKWRKHKILPPTIKKGGRVFFRRDEILKSLEKWEQKNKQGSVIIAEIHSRLIQEVQENIVGLR